MALNFTPVPGVWYYSESTDQSCLYAPGSSEAGCSWLCSDASNWEEDSSTWESEVPDDLVPLYDPHPQMIEQWFTYSEQPSQYFGPHANEEEARQVVSQWKEKPVLKLYKRSVTEWEEVSQ